uniref:MICOS complex subunit n=1 Tax=Steinernema glaseri TaxID=37863 RepID=A0A1I7ZMZ7_9BILA
MGGLYSRPQSTVVAPTQATSHSYEELLFKLEQQRVEREIALIQAIEERKAALRLAEAREALKWSIPTGLLTIALSVASAYKHKNLLHFSPTFPIAGYLGYAVNNCYGKNREVVLNEAEKIYTECGPQLVPEPISTDEVHERITQMHEDTKSHF